MNLLVTFDSGTTVTYPVTADSTISVAGDETHSFGLEGVKSVALVADAPVKKPRAKKAAA